MNTLYSAQTPTDQNDCASTAGIWPVGFCSEIEETMKDMSIVTSTRRLPQLGEVAILTQRKITLLNDIELYGKAISEARFKEMCNELAEVENALAWFGGSDEEADHAEETNFSRMGY
jgi:hypothetical protein